MVRYAILGPIGLFDGERQLRIGGRRQVALLAFLLVHANRAVSSDRLVDALWGEEVPVGALPGLHVAISRLRKAFAVNGEEGEPALRTVAGGYLLAVGPGELDGEVFQTRMEEGRRALKGGDVVRARDVLGEALGLWRGPALAEVAYEEFAQPEIRRLEELRLAALEARVDCELQLGEHGTVIAELEALVATHPGRERLAAQLMLALYRCGRQAEALEVYARSRAYLSGELGLEPGPALKALQRDILEQSTALAAQPASAATAATSPLPLRSARVRAAFVGREAELDVLRRLFAAAESGSCRLALLEGEPGIGKTRLSVQFAQDCQQQGAVVLYGRCDPESVVPYQPFLEALRGALGAGVLQPLRQRIPGHLAELARVLPELADAAGVIVPALGADDTAERYRLLDAVATVLAEASRARPMLLILDDLHWADKATLLMLRQVVRFAGEAPMLVLGTYRDSERGEALLDALADLHREHVLHRILLSGLDQDQAAQLIEQISDHDVTAQFSYDLWEQCRGNPFFLEEMLLHQSPIERGAGAADGLPHAVADVIGRRLARVSPEASAILEIACVAGNRFSIDVLERLGELSEDVLDAVLCEAIEAHLIEEVPGVYGRFAFEHALIRQTLYERLTQTRRARLHLRVGEALEDQTGDDGSRLAELAHHYRNAPPSQGRTKAAHYAVLAARHALEVLAFEDAIRHYNTALSLSTGKADTKQRHDLLLELGDAQTNVGDARGARVTFSEAGEIARAIGSATGFARALIGYPVISMVTDEEMVTQLEEAMQWLGDDDPILHSRLLSRLVIELSLSHDPARVSALSEHAFVVARRTGDRGALSAALIARHWLLWTPENLDERQQISTEFLQLAASAGSAQLAIQGHRWRLMDLFELGDIDGAEVAVEAFSALAQKRKLPAELWWMDMFRATRLLLAARYEEAEAHSRAGFALGNRVGDPSASSVFTLQMITLKRDCGGLQEFEDDVRAHVARYPAIPGWRCVLAHMLCELGRLDEARQELESLSPNAFDILPRDTIWLGAIAYCSEVASRLDEHAAALYELLLPFPDRNVIVGWTAACLGSSSRPLALLAATLDRHDDAIVHFENALAMNERMGAAAWLARTRVEYGQFLLDQDGDAEHAAALIEQGLHDARQLGIAPLITSAARALGQAWR